MSLQVQLFNQDIFSKIEPAVRFRESMTLNHEVTRHLMEPVPLIFAPQQITVIHIAFSLGQTCLVTPKDACTHTLRSSKEEN